MPAYLPQLAFQPYVQPSAGGEPIKELSDLGTTLNNNYNESIAKNDALNEHLAQLKATLSPVDHPLIDQIEQATRGDLADIQKNGNWENAQMPLRAAARRLLENPALLTAQLNAATRQKQDEYAAQAQASGQHLIQFKDLHNVSSVNPDGSLNRLSLDGVFDRKLEYLPKQQSIFQGLEPDSYSSKTSKPERDDTTGQIYQSGDGHSYRKIDQNKIKNIVNNNLDNYINTVEGQQQMKVLTSKNSDNNNPVSPEQAREAIRQQLMNIGLTHKFSDVSSDSSQKLAPGKQQQAADGTTLMADVAQPETGDFSSWLDALDKKPRDKIDFKKSQLLINNPNSDQLLATGTSTPMYDEVPEKYKEANSTLFSMFSNMAKTKNPDIINPMIKQYLKSNQNQLVTPMVHVYSDPKVIEAQDKYIKNGAVDMMPLMDNQNRVYTSRQDPKFQEDHPKAAKEEAANKAKMVGYYGENNPYSELAGSKGSQFIAPRKVIIGDESFVAGSIPQDTKSPDYLSKYLGNKITLSDRTGGKLPVTFTNPENPNDKVHLMSKGDGSYIIQGKSKDGKDIVVNASDVNAAKQILAHNNYTKAE